MTRKGQVTIPKKIRDTLGLESGSRLDFDLDEQGRIVILTADDDGHDAVSADRFQRVRGRATVKWETDRLMRLLRSDD